MDISFHYFAVKAVARAAGFNEPDAQKIAEFSQFIDDYNWYAYFKANNIPEYIKNPSLDIVFNELFDIVNPVTTGFYDNIDMATLILPRSQKFTVSPFHFIPQDKASVAAGDYRTVPATIGDNSYISNQLSAAAADFTQGRISRSDSLMRIGMLLHTFADTHAHQLFTGYANSSNSVMITNVTDNITGEDKTEEYRFYVEKWIKRIESIIKIKLPLIGHMIIGHVPDLTHISFTMKYTSLDGKVNYHSRSNTSTFVKACEEIYEFLCSLSDATPDMRWDELAPKLADGFLINATAELDSGEEAAMKKLLPHWSAVFDRYYFAYNNDKIKNSFITASSEKSEIIQIGDEDRAFIGKTYSNDFYRYNYFADKHLISLYGAHPRNLLSEDTVEFNNIASTVG